MGGAYLPLICNCASGQVIATLDRTCNTPPSASACGIERWTVKTGVDPQANLVSDGALSTTIGSLLSFAAPASLPENNRVLPVEIAKFSVDARLVKYRRTEDSDYHLVLQDAAGRTMIVEVPHPDCVAAGSPFKAQVVEARRRIDTSIIMSSTFRTADWPVRVAGVGFFDRLHGQEGVAPNGIELHPVTAIEFNPSPGALAVVKPETGWWWNPAESGRGFTIEVNGNNMFMATFLYDVSGRSTWYATVGGMNSDGSYGGPLQEFAGGQTLVGPYRPAAPIPSRTNVILSCVTSTACNLIWAGGIVPIQRFVFDPATSASNSPETGWWWNATESGRGYFLEGQGNTLAAATYMYDDAGAAVWYLTSGAMTGADFRGMWSQFRNGQSLTGAYAAPSVVGNAGGPVTLQFQSKSAGILTLPDGSQIQVSRFRF